MGWLVLGDAIGLTLFSLEENFGPKERLRQSRGEESSSWWLGVGQAGDSFKVTQADKAPSVKRLVKARPKASQDARYGRGRKIVWPCGRVFPSTTHTLHSTVAPAVSVHARPGESSHNNREKTLVTTALVTVESKTKPPVLGRIRRLKKQRACALGSYTAI